MAIATVLAVGSLVSTGVQTVMQAQGQRRAARVTTQVADWNARLQENQAIQRDMEAREAIRRQRKEGRRLQGAQRAAIAASGVTMEGSPLEILGETAARLEMGVQDAARVAEAEKRLGFSQAGMTRFAGEQQARTFRTQARSTLLSGFASGIHQAGRFGQMGVPGFGRFAPSP